MGYVAVVVALIMVTMAMMAALVAVSTATLVSMGLDAGTGGCPGPMG